MSECVNIVFILYFQIERIFEIILKENYYKTLP